MNISNNNSIFRKLKETTWLKTEDQLNENSIVVKGLEPGHTYQFRVVAVDGEPENFITDHLDFRLENLNPLHKTFF